MNYSLSISHNNIRPHLDIENDIAQKKEGLFSFNLRIDKGNIIDYVCFETITISEYGGSILTIGKERGITYDTGNGSEQNAIRPGNR